MSTRWQQWLFDLSLTHTHTHTHTHTWMFCDKVVLCFVEKYNGWVNQLCSVEPMFHPQTQTHTHKPHNLWGMHVSIRPWCFPQWTLYQQLCPSSGGWLCFPLTDYNSQTPIRTTTTLSLACLQNAPLTLPTSGMCVCMCTQVVWEITGVLNCTRYQQSCMQGVPLWLSLNYLNEHSGLAQPSFHKVNW